MVKANNNMDRTAIKRKILKSNRLPSKRVSKIALKLLKDLYEEDFYNGLVDPEENYLNLKLAIYISSCLNKSGSAFDHESSVTHFRDIDNISTVGDQAYGKTFSEFCKFVDEIIYDYSTENFNSLDINPIGFYSPRTIPQAIINRSIWTKKYVVLLLGDQKLTMRSRFNDQFFGDAIFRELAIEQLPLLENDILNDKMLQKEYKNSFNNLKVSLFSREENINPSTGEVIVKNYCNYLDFLNHSGSEYIHLPPNLYKIVSMGDNGLLTKLFSIQLKTSPRHRMGIIDFISFLNHCNENFNTNVIVELLDGDGVSHYLDDYSDYSKRLKKMVFVYRFLEELFQNFDDEVPITWQWELLKTSMATPWLQ